MIIVLLGILTASFFAYLLLLFLEDTLKAQKKVKNQKISVLIPCYNDAASISHTIKSIYQIINPDELIIINDCSTDNSKETLEVLQEKYPFELIHNTRNLGKTPTLNTHVERARNEIILLIDADIIVKEQAFKEVMRRISHPRVGAVSAPYSTQEKGFFPRMQAIEFNLLSLIIGSLNHKSTIALWGGFLAIKKEAFFSVGKFSPNAFTEDVDLAAKLNDAGFRVEQSICSVETHLPKNFKSWVKQKYRWNMGAMQCSLTHQKLWLKKPTFFLFPLAYSTYFSFLLGYGTFMLLTPPPNVLYSPQFLFGIILCPLIFFPALPPSIRSWKDICLIPLLLPFAFLYIPLHALVSLASWIGFFKQKSQIEKRMRAW